MFESLELCTVHNYLARVGVVLLKHPDITIIPSCRCTYVGSETLLMFGCLV